MSDQSQDLPQPSGRQDALLRLQNLKMTESAHRFVRGSATQFYKWLANLDANLIPTGPAVWICGDCHVGNLGPVANAQGKVEIQIRDLDQTVIGNPAHDLLRLALSLASAARGSDLPGVATFLMMESLMEGYELAFAPDFDAEADLETPPSIAMSLGTSTRANWKTLAVEKLSTEAAHLSLGEKFWPLAKNEHEDVSEAVKAGEVKHLATMLKSRPTEADVHLLDAAYWVKGCSSLGKLRYAALIAVASKKKKHHSYGLLDFKEGVGSVAPPASEAQMPENHADRIVEGAKHLSPHLGKRMTTCVIAGKPIFVRELMPQDLKFELDQLDIGEATKISAYLGAVVGKAHSRQMSVQQREQWLLDLTKQRTVDLNAPAWLWRAVVELLGEHEKAYLAHCRRYALSAKNRGKID